MNNAIRNFVRNSYGNRCCVIRQYTKTSSPSFTHTFPRSEGGGCLSSAAHSPFMNYQQQLAQRQQQQQQQQQPQPQTQTRFISKYISKSAKKRIPLTTKRAGKGYYKGNGATKEGRLTSKGRFIADPKKQLELMVPDLEGFNLKPYIARKASKIAPEFRKGPGQA